eukprot:s327_g23.t1
MNDAIPGEVVRRSEKFEKSGPSTKALAETDITAVLSKGSGTREKWLKKALQQVSDGELQAVDIYNILKVPDFAADLKEKTGRSMYKFLMSRISVFSKGQQRFLAKECPLAQQFGGEGGAAEPIVDDSKQNPEAAEEMMARVRQFVRQQQGVELDQAVAGVAAVPPPPPAAPAALVPPAVRQDMSAVANIIARASNTAVNYQAAKAAGDTVPPAPAPVPVAAPVAAPVAPAPAPVREEKASSESEVRQREPSSSPSRRKSKKKKQRSPSRTRKNRSRSRDRRRR